MTVNMADQPTPKQPATMHPQSENSAASESAAYPTPIITTSRLIIRPMHLPDAASTAQNADNPLIAKYMSLAFPSPYTLERAEGWINMNTALPYQEAFVICERSSPHVVIGGIGFTAGADVYAHTGEVGYWMGQAYWGKGYMTEVLGSFTRWVFENWNKDGKRIRRICGHVFSSNVGSIRCFEKCGFAHEGLMKGHAEKHGEVMDVHIFGLTKLDWEKKMSEAAN